LAILPRWLWIGVNPQTEQEPEEQPAPEPPKSLGASKEELAAALKNFTVRAGEVERLEQRVGESEHEEEDLLNSSTLSEEQQVEKLSKAGARKRVLERKLEHGRKGRKSAEAELEAAIGEAFRSFDKELSDLRSSRQARHVAALKKLVNDEQWPWAGQHAASFVRFCSDLVAIEWLGHQARVLLDNGRLPDAAEQLFKDSLALEAEKAAGAAKR
jgi:hypothetical protein